MISRSLMSLFIKKKLTLSTAESCTGGLISKIITDTPGASEYFLGGLVVYSNSAKKNLLGVSDETLKIHGAVSPECAREMAIGCQKIFSSDIAISVTGIAGPAGGTPDKPVGTMYFHYQNRKQGHSLTAQFSGNRKTIRQLAAEYIIEILINDISSTAE